MKRANKRGTAFATERTCSSARVRAPIVCGCGCDYGYRDDYGYGCGYRHGYGFIETAMVVMIGAVTGRVTVMDLA